MAAARDPPPPIRRTWASITSSTAPSTSKIPADTHRGMGTAWPFQGCTRTRWKQARAQALIPTDNASAPTIKVTVRGARVNCHRGRL